MKKVIDVPVGHTVTIRQEGGQIVIETKLVSKQGVEGAPEENTIEKVSIFDFVKPGDVLKSLSGEFVLFEGVKREKETFGSTIVVSTASIAFKSSFRGLARRAAECFELRDFKYKNYAYATQSEKQQLFDALRDKYALMWNGKGLVNWRAKPQQTYYILDAEGPLALVDSPDDADDRLYKSGNYFPEGFLTKARIDQFKKGTSKLFASWRK